MVKQFSDVGQTIAYLILIKFDKDYGQDLIENFDLLEYTVH